MSSQLRFKFRNDLQGSIVQFDGHHLTVGEAKILIAEKKGLGPEAIPELSLHNQSLKIDYDDDAFPLLKNTTVLVKRTPLAQRPLKPLLGATPAPAAIALPEAAPQPLTHHHTTSAAAVAATSAVEPGTDISIYGDDAGPLVPTDVLAFMENAAKGIFSADQLAVQQAGRGGQGRRRRAMGGAWREGRRAGDCPTKDDAAFDKRYRHPAGIPVCKIQRNPDGSLFLPDGEAGEMAPNSAAFRSLAAMLPNAPPSASPDLVEQQPAAVAAASGAPPASAAPTGPAIFMPSLTLPPPLPNLKAPASAAPSQATPPQLTANSDTLALALFGEEEEQHIPSQHVSLALGMGALPAHAGAGAAAATSAAHAPRERSTSEDLLGVGYDADTLLHLLPALQQFIPKDVPIKTIVSLFGSKRPLTAEEFIQLQQNTRQGNEAPARDHRHSSKASEATVKRDERKRRRRSRSRSRSPSLARRNGDSSSERRNEPAPLERQQQQQQQWQQMQPPQRFDPQQMGQGFRGGDGNGRRDGSRPPDFGFHNGNGNGPRQQQQQQLGMERDHSRMGPDPGRMGGERGDGRMGFGDRDSGRLGPERDGSRMFYVPPPPLTRRPSSNSASNLPRPAPAAAPYHTHPSTTATAPTPKSQHTSDGSQRVKLEPAAAEKDRSAPKKSMPPSTKRHGSPAPRARARSRSISPGWRQAPAPKPPAPEPARAQARTQPRPSRSQSHSPESRSPQRSRPRADSATERWQPDSEQSGPMENLPLRVPRPITSPSVSAAARTNPAAAPLSPHHAKAAAAAAAMSPVHAKTAAATVAAAPGSRTAASPAAAAAEGDGGDAAAGNGGGMSRWEGGGGGEGEQEEDEQALRRGDGDGYDDEGMDPVPEEAEESRKHESRALDQQEGVSKDGQKQRVATLRLSSPSSAEGRDAFNTLQSKPSEGRAARSSKPEGDRLGSGRDTSPDGKASDRKSGKKHRRHKEGKERKHKSKRQRSSSPVATLSPPPAAREPPRELETQPERTESRKHKSSSRHRSEREDTGRKREAADDGPSRREERQAPVTAAPVTDKVKDTKPDSKSSRSKRSSSHRS
ncbi:MAG: hypothetical protein WDW38_010019 [Sanguina aurantia]